MQTISKNQFNRRKKNIGVIYGLNQTLSPCIQTHINLS